MKARRRPKSGANARAMLQAVLTFTRKMLQSMPRFGLLLGHKNPRQKQIHPVLQSTTLIWLRLLGALAATALVCLCLAM